MRRMLIIGMLWCAGCGNEQSSHTSQAVATNHGWGYEYEQTSTVTGIHARERYWPEVQIDEIDRVFIWTGEHMLLTPTNYPALLVIYARPVEIDPSGSFGGTYYSDTNTILVYPRVPQGVDIELCHEMTHYFLFQSTGDADANHNSPFFHDCFSIFQLAPGEHRTIP